MKQPCIGINMDYEECGNYAPADLHFRDQYRIYTPYVDSVCKAGGLPLLVPPLEDEDIQREYVKRADGFLFIGGKDYPPASYGEAQQPETKLCHQRRYSVDLNLARLVLSERMPVLGICGGIQLINIDAGGKLIQQLETAKSHHARSDTEDSEHYINVLPDTILARIFGTARILVNSAHHQAIDPKHIGRELQVTAQADDGVIEAVESVGKRFLVGVQWHPERIRDEEHQKRLFGALVGACA